MLTVIREMADAAERVSDRPLEEAVAAILAEGEASVVRTQGMLDVLRDAGVVDAGAAGLLEFARGAFAGLRGQEVEAPIDAIAGPDRPRGGASRAVAVPLLHGVSRRGGRTSTARRLERTLLEMGDCLLVVGEAPLVKVHVHTDDPGAGDLGRGRSWARSTGSRSPTCTSRPRSASGGWPASGT